MREKGRSTQEEKGKEPTIQDNREEPTLEKGEEPTIQENGEESTVEEDPTLGKGEEPTLEEKGEEPTLQENGEEPTVKEEESTIEKEKGEEPTILLATSIKHIHIREEADRLYRRNAERMQLKYSKAKRKKVLTFTTGDIVSVRIPRIDRTSTDFQRVPCVVVERLGSEFFLYRLRYVHCSVMYLQYCISIVPVVSSCVLSFYTYM